MVKKRYCTLISLVSCQCDYNFCFRGHFGCEVVMKLIDLFFEDETTLSTL